MNILEGNKKYYVVGIVVIVVFIVFYSIRHFFLRNSPPMLRSPLAGTMESALMWNKPINFVDTNNGGKSSYGVTIPNMPTNSESDLPTEMALFLFVRPDNIMERNVEEESNVVDSLYRKGKDSSTTNSNFSSELLGAPILSQGNDCFEIRYDSSQNSLILKIKLLYETSLGKEKRFQEFVIKNALKVQKWNMVLINIKDRHLDLYIDGILKDTFLLKNVPIVKNSKFTFFDYKHNNHSSLKFYGIVSCARFFNFALNHKDARSLFHKYKHQMESMNSYWYLYWPHKYRPSLFT